MEQQKTDLTVTVGQSDLMMQTLLNPAIFEQMQRSAKLFSESGLVPKTFEKNPAACFVGLQLAAQLGVNPFMLFQKIYSPGGGKIGIETQVAVAVANQRGIFTGPIQHEFSGEGKTRACTATATLTKSGQTVTLRIGWDTVEGEGWTKNAKWKSMPDQMFRYRTSLWLIRTYAPEVLMGLYGSEELEDSTVIDVTPTVPLAERLAKVKAAEPIVPAEIIKPEPAKKAPKATPVQAHKPAPANGNGNGKKLMFFACQDCAEVITVSEKLNACRKCNSVRVVEKPTLPLARESAAIFAKALNTPKPLTDAQQAVQSIPADILALARDNCNLNGVPLEKISDDGCSALIDMAGEIERSQSGAVEERF